MFHALMMAPAHISIIYSLGIHLCVYDVFTHLLTSFTSQIDNTGPLLYTVKVEEKIGVSTTATYARIGMWDGAYMVLYFVYHAY